MSLFNALQAFRSLAMVLFIIGISLSPVFLTGQPVAAQVPPTSTTILPVSGSAPLDDYCLHVMTVRLPHCRGRLIWLVLKRWVATHLQLDTTRWGLPVYIEFDLADRWQRVSFLCLHLTRSAP